MGKRIFKLGWRDGREHHVRLVEEDRRKLIPEINGTGGANDILRWIRANATNLHIPNGAIARITDGMIERAAVISEWDGGGGGFQSKMPMESLRRAGLLPGKPSPTQQGLL